MPSATDRVPVRFADPDLCPDCRHRLPAGTRTVCASCGLLLQGTTAADLFATLRDADRLLAELRRAPLVGTVASPAPGAPVAAHDWSPPYPAPAPPPVRQPSTATTWSVPSILLGLGALCLLVGAVVFLAVTWSVLGVGGRTAVLIALTGLAGAATALCARRALRGAAEALSVVTGAFVALDVAGAFNAGWLGDPEPATALLLGAFGVAATLTAGNLALAGAPAGRLVSPQVLASLAVVTGTAASLVRFADALTTTATVGAVALAGVVVAARRLGQPVLAGGAAVAAGTAWLSLVLDGFTNVDEHVGLGAEPMSWTAVAPFLAAGVLAATLGVTRLPHLLRGGAGVTACWLVGVAVGLAVVTTPTGVVVLATVGALGCAAPSLLLGRTWLAWSLAAAAGGYAAVAVVPATTTVAALVAGLAEAVTDVRSADADLSARAALDLGGLAAGWTIPVAAVALAVAGIAVAGRQIIRRGGLAWSAALVALPVVAMALLCSAPVLLLAVAAAAGACVLHLTSARHGAALWPADLDRVAAVGWALAAGALATYHPAPSLVIAAAATAYASFAALRGSRELAVAAPALLTATVAAAAWWAGWAPERAALVAVVATCVHAGAVGLVLRRRRPTDLATRWCGYVAALLVALLTGVAGAAAAPEASTADWMVGYLVVTGCAAAAVGMLERVREAAWVAASLQLGALWLRLVEADVATTEAYSLPLAGVLLAFGARTLWRDPDAGSVRTLGPGLAAALAPTLVVVLDDPVSLRALLLGLACGALLVVAAVGRLRAPLLAGAGAGLALVLVELAPYHDAVPRWLALSAAGLVLLVAGIRWEQLARLGRREWGRVSELR